MRKCFFENLKLLPRYCEQKTWPEVTLHILVCFLFTLYGSYFSIARFTSLKVEKTMKLLCFIAHLFKNVPVRDFKGEFSHRKANNILQKGKNFGQFVNLFHKVP